MSSAKQWEDLLDTFERNLDDPMAPVTPWTPADGPIPVELAERAEKLLVRFEQVTASLLSQMVAARTEIRGLSNVPQGTASDAAAFLDVDS